MAERSFGWVQDSGNFKNLKRILQACDRGSLFQKHLKTVMIPTFVPARYYLFISSKFTGEFQDRLNYIKKRTNYNGSVITAENLLLFAEELMNGWLSYQDSFNLLRQNKEIVYT